MIAEVGGKVALEWMAKWAMNNLPETLVKPFKEKIAILEGELDKLRCVNASINRMFGALGSDDGGLWANGEIKLPYSDFNDRISRLPVPGSKEMRPAIITLINYKGGVGKTTTTANLAAYFDSIGKRVLLIDLDYQGSLTTSLEAIAASNVREQGVAHLFKNGDPITLLEHATRRLTGKLNKASLAPAFYGLARIEEKLMIEWLLGRLVDDARYRLANVLLHDNLRSKYDIVLIDAAPRLTTASINALCTSTHVIVPAIFDRLSAEPVVNFLAETQTTMNRLNPKLQFLGVLETMSPPGGHRQGPRESALASLKEQLTIRAPNVPILTTIIARKPELTEGGLGSSTVQSMFADLGKEVTHKIGVI